MDNNNCHIFPEYVEVENKSVSDEVSKQETTNNEELLKEIYELKSMIKKLTETLGG